MPAGEAGFLEPDATRATNMPATIIEVKIHWLLETLVCSKFNALIRCKCFIEVVLCDGTLS
jgi:hypothetical protein